MPSYKYETEQYHMERIREVLALKPQAGARTIREVLEKDLNVPVTLDRGYILKLKRKIEGERIHRFDKAQVEQRLAEIQDRTENVVSQMWRVLLDVKLDERVRIQAARVILDAEHKFFDAQMNSGIFERKLGTFDVRHSHKLAPEQQLLILRALSNYGIVKYEPDNTIKAELPQPQGGPSTN